MAASNLQILDGGSFAYDPFGRRASKTVNGTTTSYLYDGENAVNETTGGSDGPGLNEHFARTTSAGTSSYLTDEQNSTIALANSSGEPTTEYTYQPFGADTTTGETSTNPYQYAGYENDGTGLLYDHARYYNPATAQFTTQDPTGMAGSGINLYQYAGGDPIDYIDPTGYFSVEGALTSVVGAVDAYTGGATTAIRGALGIGQPDFSSSAYQAGAGIGIVAAALTPGDEEAAALDTTEDLAADAADEANSITSTVRATPGGDGAESVIIKERAPSSETVQVVHQVGKPLPGGGTLIIHQHAKYGPLPGSELFFPDVNP